MNTIENNSINYGLDSAVLYFCTSHLRFTYRVLYYKYRKEVNTCDRSKERYVGKYNVDIYNNQCVI